MPDFTLSPRGTFYELKMCRPPLNILNIAMLHGMAEALETAQHDINRSHGLVVSAEGKAFSAGVDVGDHNPEDYVSRSAICPVLLIHGAADDMIPPTEAQRLQTAVGPQAQLWLVEGAGHLQAMGHPDYRERLRRFLED